MRSDIQKLQIHQTTLVCKKKIVIVYINKTSFEKMTPFDIKKNLNVFMFKEHEILILNLV